MKITLSITRTPKDVWEIGYLNAEVARRHKVSGIVQTIFWHKGDQKDVDGIGHLKDKWVTVDSSRWDSFEKETDA